MGNKLHIAPIEYVLVGKLLFIGDIKSISDSEVLEFQDTIDFLILYHANKDNINMNILEKEAQKLGLESTLKRLLSIKFPE